MNNITIRNIPENVLKKLKRRADVFHRSLNSEIIACLEETLLPNKIEINKLLEESEKIRKRQKFTVELDDLNSAKQSGKI